MKVYREELTGGKVFVMVREQHPNATTEQEQNPDTYSHELVYNSFDELSDILESIFLGNFEALIPDKGVVEIVLDGIESSFEKEDDEICTTVVTQLSRFESYTETYEEEMVEGIKASEYDALWDKALSDGTFTRLKEVKDVEDDDIPY